MSDNLNTSEDKKDAVEENKSKKSIFNIKHTFLKISGYTSPLKSVALEVKRLKDENSKVGESLDFEGYLKANEIDELSLTKSYRNLTLTCLILLLVFVFSTYKLIMAGSIIDSLFSLCIMLLSAIYFIKYKYHKSMIEKREIINFKDWISKSFKRIEFYLP